MSRLLDAIRAAEDALCERQARDGCWRDYDLEPGRAEAWTTAVVGYALACAPEQAGTGAARARARRALIGLRRESGWGYNARTACDADSTAWTLRFLAREGADPADAVLVLGFVDDDGGVHTFHGACFGTWAHAHDCVAPVVGLALVETGVAPTVVARLRDRAIETFRAQGLWRGFWWVDPAYAIARNLEFLAASGGIPRDLVERAPRAHAPRPTAATAAAWLCAAHVLGEDATYWTDALLDAQCADGTWPGSSVLRVSSQVAPERATLHVDDGLFTTGLALLALKHLATR